MKSYLSICFISILLVITSCDQRPQSNKLNHDSETYTYTTYDPTPLTALMNAEIAISRQQYNIAARNYLSLATLYQSTALVKRATQIAILNGDLATAIRASSLWASWEPYDMFAQYLTITLSLNAKQSKNIMPFLQNIAYLNPQQTVKTILMIVSQLSSKESKQIFLNALQSLVKQYPENAALLLSYAALAFDMDQNEFALTNIEHALKLNPQWVKAISLKTQILSKQKDPQEAISYIKSEMIKHPTIPHLQSIYAEMLNQLNRTAEAKQQYLQLLKIPSQRGNALINLAKIAYKQNNIEQAVTYLKQTLSIQSHATQARYMLGLISQDTNQYHEALKWYLGVIKGPYYINAQINTASIIALEGKQREALMILDKLALPSLQQLNQVLLAKANILIDGNQFEEAFAILNRGVGLMPDNPEFLYTRAMVAEKLGYPKIAEEDLLHTIKLQPDNAHALNALGYILVSKTTRYQEALGYIKEALKYAPSDPAILDSMGWVQYRLGNLSSALIYLRKAYKISNDGEIAAHLGEVLWTTGKYDEAKRIWSKGLKDAPEGSRENKILFETMQRLINNS